MKLTEAHIQQTCTEFLALDGWRALRTDPVSDRFRGKGFGEKGMADYLYIRYPEPQEWGDSWPQVESLTPIRVKAMVMVMWIEWKRVREGRKVATKAALNQTAWHASERARGALTLIAGVDFPASIEGFQEFYRKSGLARRV